MTCLRERLSGCLVAEITFAKELRCVQAVCTRLRLNVGVRFCSWLNFYFIFDVGVRVLLVVP